MRKLWKVYALPIVDYCSPLWFSPNSPNTLRELEETQYYFMRKSTGPEASDYWTVLRRSNLLSIQRRMERFIILNVWKSLEGLSPNIGFKFNTESNRIATLRLPKL